MSESKKKIYLIDASSLFFRAYYAMPVMQAKKKKSKQGFLNTNAVYGYLKITLKILEDFKPQYLVHCFDRKEPSHRVDYYPPYKANRGEMPEDLEEQIPYIHQITEILGIPKMDLKKYEADDLIGSYALWGQKNNFEVTIISSDKDFSQLVSKKGIYLFDPMKEEHYDENRVHKKWGVWPSQIVDYLALAGDSSDNIPGVRGIGPKGAVKLLNEYKTLEGIYQNVEKVAANLSGKLKSFKEDAFVSQRLARIVTDLKLVSSTKDLEKKTYSRRSF